VARIRTIKPEFFRHHDLYKAEKETGLPLRVAYAGLWTEADREGRFKWSAPELKLGCLPYDEVDFSRALDALLTRGFIVKYASQGREYGWIPSFTDHQVINNRESPSHLPEPNENNILTREPRVDDATVTRLQGKGKEGKGKEGDGAEPQSDSTPQVEEPAVIAIPLNDNTEFPINQKSIDHWRGLYPAVDVLQELRNMRGWSEANTAKRKTLKGVMRFVNGWLAKVQNSPRPPPAQVIGFPNQDANKKRPLWNEKT
jgi:hypothetical protein